MSRIIAALALIVVIASCTKPKDLEFVDIQNIKMLKLGLSESQIGLDVRFYNPNNQRVNIREALAKVYVNSTFLGDTRMDTTISVPRRDTFSVPLILNIKSMSAVSQIVQSLSDSTVNIKVDGNVKMGKAGLFKSFPISYNKDEKVADLMSQMNVAF